MGINVCRNLLRQRAGKQPEITDKLNLTKHSALFFSSPLFEKVTLRGINVMQASRSYKLIRFSLEDS